MGIKFYCPNGHKLNVKTFLSGKKAICPKCGARVLVPAPQPESDFAIDDLADSDAPPDPPDAAHRQRSDSLREALVDQVVGDMGSNLASVDHGKTLHHVLRKRPKRSKITAAVSILLICLTLFLIVVLAVVLKRQEMVAQPIQTTTDPNAARPLSQPPSRQPSGVELPHAESADSRASS